MEVQKLMQMNAELYLDNKILKEGFGKSFRLLIAGASG